MTDKAVGTRIVCSSVVTSYPMGFGILDYIFDGLQSALSLHDNGREFLLSTPETVFQQPAHKGTRGEQGTCRTMMHGWRHGWKHGKHERLVKSEP